MLASRERALGAEHPDVLTSSYNLALCLKAQQKFPEALAFMQRAEAGWAKVLGAEAGHTRSIRRECERIEAALKEQQTGGK